MNNNLLSRGQHVSRFHGAQPNPAMSPQSVPGGQQRVAVGGYFQPRDPACYPPLPVPAGLLAPGAILRDCDVPIMALSQALPGGQERCVQVFPTRGTLVVDGVRACNGCFEILITRLEAGGISYDRLGNGLFDVGLWNTQFCKCPIDIGCVQRDNPISICFRAFGTPTEPPFLNLAFYGVRDQAQGCYPGLATVLAAQGYVPGAVGFGPQPAVAGPVM
jgi:hypothetical protein